MSEEQADLSNEERILASMIGDRRLARLEAVLDQRLDSLTVLLEDVFKPQNMGACIRTLEACGIQNIHVIEGEAPFVPNPKVTQGCDKWVDLHRHADAESAVCTLHEAGYRVLATDPRAQTTFDELELSEPTALCFGNEKDGISQRLFDRVDGRFRIPMAGFTSCFNLSVALALCMYPAAAARRRFLGVPGDLLPERRAALRSQWLRLARKGADQILRALSRRSEDT